MSEPVAMNWAGRPGYEWRVRRQEWVPVLTLNGRAIWQVQKRVHDEDAQDAYYAWMDARNSGRAWETPAQRVGVHITYHVRARRRHRDFDNAQSLSKGLLDGLVQAGCVVDDSMEHLTLTVDWEQAPDYSVTVVVKKEE